MRKRIADIVTRFRAEGLGPVRAALKQVADAARKTRADVDRNAAGMGRSGARGAQQTANAWQSSLRQISTGIRGMGREFESVSNGMSRAASRTGTAIARGLTAPLRGVGKAGKGVFGALMKEPSVPIAAILGAGAAAWSALPVIKGGLALGGAGIAGAMTIADLENVRRLSEAGGISPEMAAQWQTWGREVGRTSDEVGDTMVKVRESVFRSLNPEEKFIPKIWERLGISITDANGDLRSASGLMRDLAVVSRDMSEAQRTYISQYLFQDGGESLEFLRRIGERAGDLQSEYERNLREGLLPSRQDIERITAFQVRMQGLWLPFKAFMRELFLTFEPFFSKVLGKFEAIFRDPGERARIIQSWFVKPFQQGYQLLNDFLQVFFGFDLIRWLRGFTRATPIVNGWLIPLQRFLSSLGHVAAGLLRLFVGVGGAILDVARAIDRAVLASTGFSISQWFDTTAAQDIRAFLTDIGRILSQLFEDRPSIDLTGYETAWGAVVAGWVQSVREGVVEIMDTFGGVFGYLRQGWEEYQRSVAAGTGLDGIETSLGQLLVTGRAVLDFFVQLGPALDTVFRQGGSAPAGFEWLEGLRDTLAGLDRLLSPVYRVLDELSRSMLGVNAAAALIAAGTVSRVFAMFTGMSLGGAAIAGLSGLATLLGAISAPMLAVGAGIAAVVGGVYLLYNLITDFTGTVERLVGYLNEVAKVASFIWDGSFLGSDASRQVAAGMDADLAAAGGPKAGAAGQFASQQDWWRRSGQVAGDRTEHWQYLHGDRAEREGVDLASQMPEIRSVDVQAQGRPIVLPLPGGGSVTTIAPHDQADALLRAYAGQLGGAR